jgi:hypothetical protein
MAEHPENKLYHSWVDLTGVDMFSKMLDTSDIKPAEVVSFLNSSFIDPIAKRVVSANTSADEWLPLPAFIKPDLKVFTTLTNLQGFNYEIPFNTAMPEKGEYHMVVHNDYACFQITEEDIPGDNGGWMPLNLKSNINTDKAGDAAMATGAFPLGLKSRTLNRPLSYVKAIPWLSDYVNGNSDMADPYLTLNVDGGMINNEPFDKVKDVLKSVTGEEVSDNFNDFSSTVLMIEPFPTIKKNPIDQSPGLLNVVGLTLSAMLKQMRSKAVHIKSALDEDCAGQYLITPSRRIPDADTDDDDIKGERAMACGALSGFSGFMNKEFRVHDYFLGRFNCKIFLRDYFTIPESALDKNEIFKQGYANADIAKFKSTKDGGIQIIPVFADTTNYDFPDIKFESGTNWPAMKSENIDAFKSALEQRIQAVLLNLFKLNWSSSLLLRTGAKVVLNGLISKAIISKIKTELTAWNLLAN